MAAALDIPYRSRDASDDDAEVDSLQYIDAGTVNVNVASTSRTARYWETRQVAPHVNDAAVPSARTTSVLSFSVVMWLMAATIQRV